MSLSESISALCEEIERSENERSQSVKQIREDSRKMMSNIHSELIKAAEEVKGLLKGFREEHAVRREHVKDLLKGFREERNAVRNELLKAFNVWRQFSAERRKPTFSTRTISSAEKVAEPPLQEGRSARRRPKR